MARGREPLPSAREKPPCYHCKDRCIGCHDYCEKYKAWKSEVDRVNDNRRKYVYAPKNKLRLN